MTITEDLSNPTAVTPNNKPRTAFAQSMQYVTNKTAKGAASCVREDKRNKY